MMVVDSTMKHTSLMSRLLVGHCKTETAKAVAPARSKIQTLPAELKLQILRDAANILVVKNLVIACPGFYPVYCENRYTLLLRCHRKSQDEHTDLLAEVVLKINQLNRLNGSESSRTDQAVELWQKSCARYRRQGRVSFVDSQPSLSDLGEVSRVHCWVIEMSEKFLQTQSPRMSEIRSLDIYKFCYYIELFAAIIGDKEHGWAAANLPRSQWERQVQYWWSFDDYDILSDIVKVIWPNGLSKTPACRRRTRALILRSVRGGTVYSSETIEH
jgi:hypothetical protein